MKLSSHFSVTSKGTMIRMVTAICAVNCRCNFWKIYVCVQTRAVWFLSRAMIGLKSKTVVFSGICTIMYNITFPFFPSNVFHLLFFSNIPAASEIAHTFLRLRTIRARWWGTFYDNYGTCTRKMITFYWSALHYPCVLLLTHKKTSFCAPFVEQTSYT